MIQYLEKDFDGMKFNPLVKEPVVKAFPELKAMVDLDKENGDIVTRYILMVYDDESVLALSIRDIELRKKKGAELVKLPAKINAAVNDCSYPPLIPMVVWYMKELKKKRLWQMIVTNEMLFSEYNEHLMTPFAAGDIGDQKKKLDATAVKSKLRQELDAIHKTLNEYYQEMFADDKLKKKVQSIKFTPEAFAKRHV